MNTRIDWWLNFNGAFEGTRAEEEELARQIMDAMTDAGIRPARRSCVAMVTPSATSTSSTRQSSVTD